jgi:hypothetical protein
MGQLRLAALGKLALFGPLPCPVPFGERPANGALPE